MRFSLLAVLASIFVATVGCGDDPSLIAPPDETCTPLTCEDAGSVCGTLDDGCGETTECGVCDGSDVCVDGACVGSCTPQTCEDVGAICGTLDDGCGETIECGVCEDGGACVDGACVDSCTPQTCEDVGAVCGTIDDGCGQTLECGVCDGSDVCVDGACVDSCTPQTCEDVGAVCGTIDDGCGQTLECGACDGSDVCVDGACVGVCTPQTCEDVGAVCGTIFDGCGQTIECGICAGSDVCVDGACVGVCTPQTCEDVGAVCGTIDDGCGGVLSCGGCGIPFPESWSWGWPRPTGSTLTSVWTFSDDDSWAVGAHGTLLHWDGASLDTIPSGTLADLNGLWASGPGDLWAVGANGTILHHDGAGWSFRDGPSNRDLVAVGGTGPDDVWILTGSPSTLIHCGPDACALAPSPLPVPKALASSEALGVWLLGAGGELASWDGSAWTVAPASAMAGLDLLAVGESIWARSGTSIVRWDAGGWVPEVASPWATWNEPIHLHAPASGGLWALTPEGASGHGLFRLEAGSWSKVETGMQEGLSLHLSTTSLWIAGARGQLSHLPLPVTAPVLLTDLPMYCQDLASVPSGQGVHWARCGVDVLRIEGDVVELLPRPTLLRNETAGRGIWSRSPDEVWLITNRYRVHRWLDGTWETFTNFGGKTLNAMAGTGEEFFVFGEKGLAWKWLGDGFSEAIQIPTQLNLLSAWASGPDDIWAAGGNGLDGVIVRWDGSRWVLSHRQKLNWIHGTSSDDVWAVGDGGYAIHWDGHTWTQAATGTTSLLRKVWAHSSGDVFIVPGTDDPALDGRFLHFDGSMWKPGPRPIHVPQAVAITPSGGMISVGDGIVIGG